MKRWLPFGCLLATCTLLPTATRGQDLQIPAASKAATALLQPEKINAPREGEKKTETPKELPPPPPLPEPIAPAPSCCGPEKILSIPRYTLVEENHVIAVPRLFARMETVGTIPGLIAVPKIEQRKITVMEPAPPREVEEDAVVTELVPETVTDCEGHCHTEYKPCQVVKKVKRVVVEMVAREIIVEVNVPTLEQAPLLVQRLVLEGGTMPMIEQRFRLHTFPNEVPIPPAPPLPCLGPPPCAPHP